MDIRAVRTVWLAIGVAVASAIVPVASGSPETSPRDTRAVTRAKIIQVEVSSRYLGSHDSGLEVTEASSSAVIESFTLLSPDLTEARIVPAARGIYYAICPVGATCPYPARRLARTPATFLPRRLALELALRTFRDTTADVVAVSLPTASFVLFVIERADLADDHLVAAARALRGDPDRSPSPALRALVDRMTRSRIFAFTGLEPTPSGRDSLAAVPLWPDAWPKVPE